MEAPLFFVNESVLRKKIRQKEDKYCKTNPIPIFYIILDCRGMTDIDSKGIQVLNELAEKYNKQGIFIGFANVNERVRKLMKSGGIDNLVNMDRFFIRIHNGIKMSTRLKCFHVKKKF